MHLGPYGQDTDSRSTSSLIGKSDMSYLWLERVALRCPTLGDITI